ncbi:MAG TPA: hypothetical protein ENN68_05475, partial [Methanomicrobia archaeon]|nr:hypothetical protein [Methanomicrobia archaeon]
MKNTSVSYNGSVTILTTGDVLIENGTINTTNSDITIISGGDITVKNGGSIYTADAPTGTSGSITLEAAGSVDTQSGIVFSGNGYASGGVLIKAFGSNTITLFATTLWTGNAELDSGDLELWSAGSIDANSSTSWTGNSINGTSGHVAWYAQGGDTITLFATTLWTGNAELDSG